jgi:hypothetical protein
VKLATPRWRMPLILTGLLVLAGLIAPTAVAAPSGKSFRADFDSAPDPIPAGSTKPITTTISNDSTTQQIGSSDITVPSGHTLPVQSITIPQSPGTATRASATVIQVRNLSLQPGASVTFSFLVKTPCQPGDYTWTLDGKQANNHSGNPGNNFLLDLSRSDVTTTVGERCRVAFNRPPADAEKSPTVITSVPREPLEDPVQVEIRSAETPGENVPLAGVRVQLAVANDPCSKTPLTLAGAIATTDAEGFAEFPDLSLNQSCVGYTLRASGSHAVVPSGFTSGVSAPFSVYDDIGKCPANRDCFASFSGPVGGSITAFASPTPGFAQIAASAEGLISCPDYAEVTGTMITFGASADRANEVNILIDRSTLDSNVGAGTFRVCYSSDHIVWTDRAGNNVPLGTPSLLPDCANMNPVAPCQLQTRTSSQFFTVRFLSPPGATRGRT